MSDNLSVKDNPTWYRRGNALVNTDVESYQAYMKKVNANSSREAEIDTMKRSINNINDEISGMKDTLSQILTLLQK